MNNPHDEGQLLETVVRTLADVLGRNVSTVSPDASLITQLGAESLDFIELTHALETKLNLELPKRGILDHAEMTGGGQPIYEGGYVSPLGHYLLRNSLYRFSEAQLGEQLAPNAVMSCATSRNWSSLCYQLFFHLPERCPDCGSQSAALAADGKALCAECRGPLSPRPGDEVLVDYVTELLRKWNAENR